MKKKTMSRAIFLGMGFMAISFAGKSQWGGSTLQTGDIYRQGNVGIGDANFGGLMPPAASLHVRNSGSLPFCVERYTSGSNQNNSLKVSFSSSTFTGAGAGTMAFQMANPLGIADMAFMNTSTNVAFVVKANGNMGLGILSPDARLTVSNNGTNKFTIYGNSTGDFHSSGSMSPHFSTGNSFNIYEGNIGSGTLRFQIAASGNTFMVPNGGNVGVNTNNPTAKLTVNGNVLIGDPGVVTLPGTYGLYVQNGVLTSQVRVAVVNSVNWADYVFAKDYKLKSLQEVEHFINSNHHLPGIPSADEVEKEGVDLVKMDAKLLEKVEELTLYIIEQNKKIEALEKEISALKK